MAPPGTGDQFPASVTPPLAAAVAASLTQARLKYGELGLAPADFAADVLRQGKAHWARQGVEADATRLEAYALRAALPDLVLASACERQVARAWDVLVGEFAPRLEGFAVRRGLASSEAESIVQDLLGDLSAPPPKEGARTLLGTYDATGSLFGWLSVVLLRRIAGRARKRSPLSLDAQEPDVREAAAPPATTARGHTSVPAGAAGQAQERETAQRVGAAVARAWTLLSAQERFALVLKHRDDRSQREIGALLGVGEARVSRIVAAGVERLTGAVGEALDGPQGLTPGGAGWQDVVATVARHLASQGPQVPPTSGKAGGSRAPNAPGRAAAERPSPDKGQA
jgi:RNA polymerase sigma factor (sigma-70 family)